MKAFVQVMEGVRAEPSGGGRGRAVFRIFSLLALSFPSHPEKFGALPDPGFLFSLELRARSC